MKWLTFKEVKTESIQAQLNEGVKNIQKIIEFLNKTSEVPKNLLELAATGKVVNHNSLDRAYYSSGSSKVWLENGFYLEKIRSSDTFGAKTASNNAVLIGNIRTEEKIYLYQEDAFSDWREGKNETATWNIKEDARWEETILNFVEEYNEPIEVSHVIEYLKNWESDVSFYKTLNNERTNPIVLEAVFQKIYTDSAAMYREIIDWNQISPYGGEDITYFPGSAAHCFMDQIHPTCEQIGVDLTDEQITELACKVLVKNNQLNYVKILVDEHKKLVDEYKMRDDAVRVFEKYENLIPYIPDEYKVGLIKSDIERQNRALNSIKVDLECLQSKKHLWFYRLFRRNIYDEHLEAIERCNDSIDETKFEVEMATDNLFKLEEKLKKLTDIPKKDMVLYHLYGMSGNITDLCEGELPTPEKINNYYESIYSKIQSVEAKLNYFKPYIGEGYIGIHTED